MDTQPHGEDKAPKGDEQSLPLGEIAPEQPSVEPVCGPEAPAIKEELASEPAQQQSSTEVQIAHQPLLIRVTKDDELSTFERNSIFFGVIGLFLATLSMAAAGLAGYFVYQQFREMEVSNNLSDIAARHFRYESDKSTAATAKQLAVLQGQLTQQQAALNLTERAWITLVSAEFRYHPDRQNIDRVDSMIIFTNTGPTPAFNVHVWRCAEVLAYAPDIKRKPPSGDPRCSESDTGILGTRTPISFETPDFTQTVPKDSLPDSVFAKSPHLYVWGKLTYYTLSKDKRHFMSFCLMNGPKWMGPCAKGNDAD